ncbi:hypothetical protein EVAR_12348_1 [Eumeta japonica]|uniref:Uncharacterized protein n=1 Tax=Eumeta variegata TaxID=151549 RepID=A0A4C1X2T6_EUMVA|nr:hypothetical protein EVAR_12348_1 [Eumeta japonica]
MFNHRYTSPQPRCARAHTRVSLSSSHLVPASPPHADSVLTFEFAIEYKQRRLTNGRIIQDERRRRRRRKLGQFVAVPARTGPSVQVLYFFPLKCFTCSTIEITC